MGRKREHGCPTWIRADHTAAQAAPQKASKVQPCHADTAAGAAPAQGEPTGTPRACPRTPSYRAWGILKSPAMLVFPAAVLLTLLAAAHGLDIVATDPAIQWQGRTNVVGTAVQFDFAGVGAVLSTNGATQISVEVRVVSAHAALLHVGRTAAADVHSSCIA
jgi:hypothetical protein